MEIDLLILENSAEEQENNFSSLIFQFLLLLRSIVFTNVITEHQFEG